MRARALISFSSQTGSYGMGHEFDLPDGADWVTVGLAEPVETPRRARTYDAPEAPQPAPPTKTKKTKRST